MTSEEWCDILLRIETPLLKWSDDKHKITSDEREKLYGECQEALRLFTEHFGNFWD